VPGASGQGRHLTHLHCRAVRAVCAFAAVSLDLAGSAQVLRRRSTLRSVDASTQPSPQSPVGGGCLCGAVRYEITRPLSAARYCHCTHCQRRTGTAASANGLVPREGFSLLKGREQLRSYKPPTGVPKHFCSVCGSALFSADPFSDQQVVVRLGTIDRDTGIRPSYRQFVDSAAPWEPIPEDGLPRYPRSASE
jgi:hypothetical protein